MTLYKLNKLKESGIISITGLAKFAGLSPSSLAARLRRGSPELTIIESNNIEDSFEQVFGDIGALMTFDIVYLDEGEGT